MRVILLIVLSILVLSGCFADSPLSFSKISDKDLSKDIQLFYQSVEGENGVHLYFDNQNEAIFVYLNGSNAAHGEKAVRFSEFEVEGVKDTLNLRYKSDEMLDDSNVSGEREHFYRVDLDKDYDAVKIFNNGKEIFFASISGNN